MVSRVRVGRLRSGRVHVRGGVGTYASVGGSGGLGRWGEGDVVDGNRSWVAVIVKQRNKSSLQYSTNYLRGSIPTITGEGRFDQTLLLDLS